ncbi:TPA: 16S rRNA (guanine(1405)-N(7))-methyltransferase ArmA [Acinetobacter baumannii]
MDKNDVVKKILESKKYENLDSDIVEKVVSISEKKYKLKEVENYSKKKLHQIWGSYYSAYPNWDKLLKKYNQGQLSIEDLLKIHSSTNERVATLNDFYTYVFGNIKHVSSILDFGCGFNPLALYQWNENEKIIYHAYDIDRAEIAFLSSIIGKLKTTIKYRFLNKESDVYKGTYDVVFLLKMLPVLKQQDVNIFDFLQLFHTQNFVISFPIKSLSGKEKGMEENYQLWFESFTKGWIKILDSKVIGNELVYITSGFQK